LANLTCGNRVKVDSALRIWGSAGNIQVANPWFPGQGEIIINRDGRETEKVLLSSEIPLYALEADMVARHVENRQAPAPCMTIADSFGQQETLDRWREEIGLVFDCEKPEQLDMPAGGQALAARPEISMPFGNVEGVAKPVSRVVMGSMVMTPRRMAYSFALLDDYFERGGNCIDTAWVYGGGEAERAVGAWMKMRDIRDAIVLIAKGAHTPECSPEGITRQLQQSLDRLQTDAVDIYMMHRDNPEIPVAEFVECLNEHQKAGRVTSFGVSNWSLERLIEANNYASEKGLTGFSSTSVNFSLAQWNEPMWPGCVAGSDEKSRAWYQRTAMPLFAWSSQASGFFTGRFSPQNREDAMRNPHLSEVARVWFNEANFARLERAQQLAGQKNTGATQIALAYVLSQPLNIFALIGPRTIEETRTSMLALDVPLTRQELRWLDSGK
jgi:aryl-alcohol dehydrogenase-like predicted oxidoreductase